MARPDDRGANVPFRWLWAGSASSTVAGEVSEVAIPLLALLVLGASASELAMVRVAQFLPFLVLTLAFGVMVDRLRRKPVLVFSNAGRVVVLTFVGAVSLTAGMPVWCIAVAVFILGGFAVMSQLTEFSILPAVVSDNGLAEANARLTSTQSAASIAGTGLGGLLVQAITAPFAVLVSAATSFVSTVCLWRMRVDESAVERGAQRPSFLTEARGGFSFLRRNRVVRDLCLEAATFNLANEILLLGLLMHIVSTYELGAAIFGGLLTASAIGALFGAFVSGRATKRFGYGPSLLVAVLVGNAAPLVLVWNAFSPTTTSLVVGSIALVLSGFGAGLANAQAVTVRQLATPRELYGRVNSVYRFLSWGMLSVGALAAGAVVTAYGASVAILVGGVGTALATVWIAFSPVRRLRTLEDAKSAE